ncbi:DNA polymerase [Levilactobacillus sp. HBUAS70063]|uniref:DNA polymerase n=1 Tax=Levilactobacillus sp. HBUAS70063 TaxID=3109359 RepID=UPI003132B547
MSKLPGYVLEKMALQPSNSLSSNQLRHCERYLRGMGMSTALDVQIAVQPLIEALDSESITLDYDSWLTTGLARREDQLSQVLDEIRDYVPTLGMYSVRDDQQIVERCRQMGIQLNSLSTQWLVEHRHDSPIIQLLLKKRNLDVFLHRFRDRLRPTNGGRYVELSGHWDAYASLSGRMTAHNLPMTALPKEMRNYFVVPDQESLISFDDNQIELRLLAGASNCRRLLTQIRNGDDIHCYIASKLFEVESKDVTPNMRKTAKTVVYALIYGGGPETLAGIVAKNKLNLSKNPYQLLQSLYPEMMRLLNEFRHSRYLYYGLRQTQLVPRIGSSWLRPTLRQNLPVQSATSLLTKQVLVRLPIDVHVVNVIYDEIICACPTQNISELKSTMLKAYVNAIDDLGLVLPANNLFTMEKIGGNYHE